MAIRCERCGRSVHAAIEVLREGKVIEFYRCRCGSKAALIPERQGPSTEIRRSRGNLFLRLRGTHLYISDSGALDASLSELEGELEKEAAHVVVNLEEVQYLPGGCYQRLDGLRKKVEQGGHHLAIVSNASSMKALMGKDTPELVRTLAENEKKAIALVGRSE